LDNPDMHGVIPRAAQVSVIYFSALETWKHCGQIYRSLTQSTLLFILIGNFWKTQTPKIYRCCSNLLIPGNLQWRLGRSIGSSEVGREARWNKAWNYGRTEWNFLQVNKCYAYNSSIFANLLMYWHSKVLIFLFCQQRLERKTGWIARGRSSPHARRPTSETNWRDKDE
jgi:hypothetical protein